MHSADSSTGPRVSVIVPAYNAAPYLAEALTSLLEQTYTDFEAIVVNDGSTDGTAQAVQPFRDRITYLEQPNQGVAATRNNALRVARGRYIALLDSDDVWLPNYLATMVGRLEADPTLDAIYPNAVMFGLAHFDGKLYQDVYPSSEPVTYEKVLRQECIIFTGVTFKRELWERVGGYDESLREGEDLDLWLRMLQHGARFGFTPEVLVRYRKREDSLSADQERIARSAIKVYEKVLSLPSTTEAERGILTKRMPALRAALNMALSRRRIAQRDYAGAVHHLTLANSYYRAPKLALIRWGLRLAPGLVGPLVRWKQAS